MGYVKTNFKEPSQVCRVGSYNNSASTSGYCTVSNLLERAPSWAYGKILGMSGGAIQLRVVEIKSLGTDLLTFLVRSSSDPIQTGSSVNFVWEAHL